MDIKKSNGKPVAFLAEKEQKRLRSLSTQELTESNLTIIRELSDRIDYGSERQEFLEQEQNKNTKRLYRKALSRWEDFLPSLSKKSKNGRKEREKKLWDLDYYEIQRYIDEYKVSPSTKKLDLSALFSFRDFLITKYPLRPYPPHYKKELIKYLKTTHKDHKARPRKTRENRTLRPDEVRIICKRLSESIEELHISKSHNHEESINKVLCTLFAVKVACHHGLLPKDFEQIQQIHAGFFVYKDEQAIRNLSDTKILSDIEDIWETIKWKFDRPYIYAMENDRINDRVRKLTKAMQKDGDLEYAWTLPELSQAKKG
jgi:hypothetical protein